MSKNVTLESATGMIQTLLKTLESQLPAVPDDRLSQLCAPANHVILVHGGEMAGKTALISELEGHSKRAGWNVIRSTCRDSFNSPFDLARDFIRRALQIHPGKATGLQTEYQEVIDALRYTLHQASGEKNSNHAYKVSDRCMRVTQQISNEATVGLIVQTINYLLELICPVKKLTVILVDDIQFADFWSASFMAHLIRRIERLPIAICITSGSKVRKSPATAQFLSAKSKPFELTLSPFKVAEERETIESILERLDNIGRLVLSYLCIFDQPASEKELNFLLRINELESEVGETLGDLQRIGAIVKWGVGRQTTYTITNAVWKGAISHRIPADRRRQFHLHIASVIQSIMAEGPRRRWVLSHGPNAVFFHLLKAGDTLRALEYQAVYYSCPVNTYYNHVTENLRRLSKTVTGNTTSSKALKRELSYQIASDVIRRTGSVKEKIRDCESHLRIERDAYRRAEIYSNLCVMYANLKTEGSIEIALEYASRAYQEAALVSDSDHRKHITAIINNSVALIRFRQRDARAAIALEEEALQLLQEARPLKDTVMVSKEALLMSLAQIYSKLLKDNATAHNIYLELVEVARTRRRVENEVEHTINIGKNLFYARQYEAALPYFLEALNIAKDNYKLHTSRMYAHKAAGLCRQFLNRHDQAIESFRDCLNLALEVIDLSEVANLLGNIGLSSYKAHEYARAACSYSRALRVSAHAQLKPQMLKYYANLGVLHADTNEYGKAAEFFSNAARISSGMGDVENVIRYYTATMNCYTLRSTPCERSVLRQIKQAVRIDNGAGNEAVYNSFAKAYLDQIDLLLQSNRDRDVGEMLRHFGKLAEKFDLELLLNQRFDRLTHKATTVSQG